jgi:dihydroneopterin aldolase
MTTTDLPGDRIFLQGMRFYGYHGVNPEERVLGQHFVVDVSVAVDLRAAGRSDEPRDTVSYSDIYRQVRDIVEGEPQNLIEAVADAIAARLMEEAPLVQSVTVTVRKPEAPIRDSFVDAAGVHIQRTRESRD